MAAEPFRCAAAILAAGASSRMGRPKTLLPWGPTTLIGHLVTLYRSQVDQVVVVCRPDDTLLSTELDALGLPLANRLPNSEAASGMFSSVRLALQWPGWDEGTTTLLLALADQPQILPSTVTRLLEAARQHPDRIIQPLHQGRRRHPVVVPVHLAPSLADHTRHHTLREALEAHREYIVALQVPDAGLSTDLDTPAQYEEAVNRFLPKQP